MLQEIYTALICHFIGDYILQTDYIAKTKGESWYNLAIHCVLYSLPFTLAYGFDGRLIFLIISHFIIDALKTRLEMFGYLGDQLLHMLVITVTYGCSWSL